MTNPITVTVTQDDIDEGMVGKCGYCPIALALRRLGCVYVSVGVTTAAVTDSWGTPIQYYHLPDEASVFVYDFDHFKSVKPFSFILNERF